MSLLTVIVVERDKELEMLASKLEVVAWKLQDKCACFYHLIPKDALRQIKLSIQVIKLLDSASNFIVFHSHSLLLLLSLFSSDFSILRMELSVHFILHTPNVYSSCRMLMGIILGTQILV